MVGHADTKAGQKLVTIALTIGPVNVMLTTVRRIKRGLPRADTVKHAFTVITWDTSSIIEEVVFT